ncbi:MAG: dihydroneopterin aldolase [Flavobacteriales bacterium]|nr:dihydroneopterin aldolase [Flavobacteriales bacterium]
MGVIAVNGIRVYAYHGCLPEEARIGGQYRVDIKVNGDFATAELTDELKDTIDYGRMTAIVTEEMSCRSKLVEHVARRILDALKREWPGAFRFEVGVTKERPPVNGDVQQVEYRIEG